MQNRSKRRRIFLKTNVFGATVLTAFLVGITQLLANQVDFSLITDKGWVRFAVGGDWKVLSMDTKTPVKVALFQIPNQADEGTPDSTNVAIILYQLNSPEAATGFGRVRQKTAKGMKSRVGAWEVFNNDFIQGNTSYSGRTAFRDVADVHVSITFAWPHLSKNSGGYDSEMEQTFRALLESVTGSTGKYPKREGEVIRRPR